MSVYRPPSLSNIDTFFAELTISLSKVNEFDNLVIMSDFNIDIAKEDCSGFGKLEELCDTFNLPNLIKSETCFTNNHKSTIDLFFTNKPFFRNYKKFDEIKFLADLKNTNFSFTSADANENYLFLRNSFSKIVEKHVPL